VSSAQESALAGARAKGLTIATAESLTGGLVAAALTSVPGASDVFVGGIVAYALDAKGAALGVPRDLLAACGPVSEEVALAMAEAARRLFGSDLAVATTGAAGPEPHGGRPPGTFCVGVAGPFGSLARTEVVAGDRHEVRAKATDRAILALCEVIDSAGEPGTSVR
jgi:nicotinamide-nucleotide amidase